MGSRIDTSLVLDALLMALWRRQPHGPVLVHCDQGCQFTGHEWQTFPLDRNLVGWSTTHVTMRELMSSTTLKCSTTHSAVIHWRRDYHL